MTSEAEVRNRVVGKSDLSSSHAIRIFSRAIPASAVLVSVLQGSLFAVERPRTTYSVIAILLAAANLFLATRFLSIKGSLLLGLVLILYCTQLGIFVVQLVAHEPPFRFRLLQVAIVLSYIATVMSTLPVGARLIVPSKAFLLSFSIAVGILVCETALQLPDFWPKEGPLGPEWVGRMESHPNLGSIYLPHSVLKTYYPDNPRGYFETEDPRENMWWVRVAEGDEANLVFPPNDSETVRIAITKAEAKTSFDIQLNEPHLTVKLDHHYIVNFRARADRPRSIIVGFAKAHEPWTGLGLYKKIELTSEWQSFQEDFVATENEDNARIHFDAGESNIPVELSSVSLRSMPEGEFIEPDLPRQGYIVSYKFNGSGCRGRDYALPRPPGTGRVLLLGDSFTLGVGVREEDTFGNQLERLLNEKAKSLASFRIYEVVNCGVSGFGTREERLFYQDFGVRYEPNIVLLVMVANDDMSFLEEVEKGYLLRRPGKFESLFYIWRKMQEYRHRRPFPDYRACIDEILQLNSEVLKQDARLAVVIFRDSDEPEAWDYMASSVTKGLEGTDITILDLGKALFEKYPDEDLRVHEIDHHPNEIAHKTAAEQILDFLQRKGLLQSFDALGMAEQ